MLTLEEKVYLLRLLRSSRRFRWFRKPDEMHRKLIEKLEQMIRNVEVNRR